MLPMRGRALLSTQWIALRRAAHSKVPDASTSATSQPAPSPSDGEDSSDALTGSAKLFADAVAEESLEATAKAKGARDHLLHSQGPIWTGDEAQSDAVLRMLVDKYKPLRTGEGIKDNAADKRIHNWMKNVDMEAHHPVRGKGDGVEITTSSGESPHSPKLPPHLFRPWHATYTGDNQAFEAPKIKFGHFDQRKADRDWSNLLELRLPPNADGTTRAKHRDFRRSTKLQGRLGSARESAIDYRLGVVDGEMTHVGAEEEELEGFSGNRQIRGNSVLGAHKGGASGMRAWAGLVEDRITVSNPSRPS